jgi:hypothetical protein
VEAAAPSTQIYRLIGSRAETFWSSDWDISINR